MEETLPLSALLSRPLVAFTIEFDNEFERQMPHRTSNHGGTPGMPWLVSMAMWTNFMQFIPETGIPLGELQRRLEKTPKSLKQLVARMGKWWGYVTVERALVRPTRAGLQAQAIWRPLTETIETRWRERFGMDKIDELKESLKELVSQLGPGLPDGLPILGYGLFTKGAQPTPGVPVNNLSALLSKVLFPFAIEFEDEAEISLAISSNVLRLAADEAPRVRDLPRLAGISREAVATALSYLEKRGYAAAQPESPGSRTKSLTLTPKGQAARKLYQHLPAAIEQRWRVRFGEKAVRHLRDSLEQLHPLLLQGLVPHPTGWRAALPKIECLPHYPMVLHRGGFPDGS